MDAVILYLQSHVQDYFLSAGVLAVFVTVIASLHAPRLKVLIFCMPVPFTCAYLVTFSTLPIDSTHMVGLLLTIGYHWAVVLVRQVAPLPAAIAAAVAGYVALAVLLRPMGQVPLPVMALLFALVWLVAVRRYRPAHEPGHRSAAPWWLKLPAVFLIANVVFALAGLLAGAVATFPYAGVFTSYEMRKSLRTLAGQYAINMGGFAAMVVTMWVVRQLNLLPAPWELVPGWAVHLLALLCIYRLRLGQPAAASLPLAPSADSP